MQTKPLLEEIIIRNQLHPGDVGYVIHLHGSLYKKEYGYGLEFERYVAKGFVEFLDTYDPMKDTVWVCEHREQIIGFLSLMHRGDASAQLRFFLLLPSYRGIGLGTKLMSALDARLRILRHKHCYLWTTDEQLEAARLYTRAGFVLTEEKASTAFGKPLKEQRYDLFL